MKLELELENCETLSFNEKDLKVINIDEIYESFIKTNSEDNLSRVKIAKNIKLIFKSSANNLKNNKSNWTNTLPFNRLMEYPDIVCIHIISKNKHSKIYTNWDYNESFEVNDKQKTKINADGTLLIEIN